MLIKLCLLLSVIPRYFCIDITYYIQEGKSPGTYLGDIAADTFLLDSIPPNEHQYLTFSQIQTTESDNSRLFHISKKTGKMYTAQMLNAESLCSYHKECFQTVEIAVRKAASFLKLIEVKVIIQDINDHRPEFPDKRVSIEFSESDGIGMRKYIPHAVDKDVGILNSQINYQLKHNLDAPFSLSVSKNIDGTSKLGINLEQRLNREAKDSYIVQVVAKDSGSPPKQSVLDVYISVSDVNDNAPVFSKKVYNVSISNEYETSPVITLSATDADSGKNGRVTYYFSSKTPESTKTLFKLNKITGEIFCLKKLILSKDFTFRLYVKAVDGGQPSLSSISMVLVNVVNQKNNPPIINVNFFSSSIQNPVVISEDINVGEFIAYVKVTDHDVGPNGDVSCVINHDKFLLEHLSIKRYQVIVKKKLDRETKDYHDVTITCQDKGSPPLHSESKFSIQVMDVNDVKPQFDSEIIKFKTFENQKSSIGFIRARDPDLGPGGKLTYSLRTKNTQFLPFQISDEGLISTLMSLDHEFKDTYEFQVFVKDNGIPSLNNTVNVIVEVGDENDNIPYFTFPSINPFNLDVIYYPHHTKNITQIKATDGDSRENAFLKYEILRGNEKQLFSVNRYNGWLSSNRALTPEDAGSYELDFVVKDSGTPVLSAKTTMVLTLVASTKPSGIPNVVNSQSDKDINLNFAIIIILVAVALSVIVTALMSIQILRNNSQRSEPSRVETNNTRRYKQKDVNCSAQAGKSHVDISGAITKDQDIIKTVHLPESKKELIFEDNLNNEHKGSTSSLHTRSSTDVTHQVYFLLLSLTYALSG